MCSKRSTRSQRAAIALALLLATPAVSYGQAAEEGAEKAAPVGEDRDAKAVEKAADELGEAAAAASPGKDPASMTEEERELAEMMSIVKDFNAQTDAYKKEIQLIVERKYDEQREAVVRSYERAISELEKEEIRRRLEAIEVFERFLAKYPDDPNYTPGALWRLAELHYEKSKYEIGLEEDAYEKKLAAFNKGQAQEEPLPPEPHFERTVGLLQRLIRDFPAYKLIDGAHYLLAYCLQEQDEVAEAEDVWTAFVKKFPKSKLLPEVYTRLGELYFDDPDKLDQAIEAYKKVLQFPDHGMYDKALYKLAWTYYKIDRFDEAVDGFDKLIAWADRGSDDEAAVTKSELRKEAMLYLAISFAEEEWSGSGVENAKAFLQAKGGRKYDGEFFRQLGEIYAIDTRYDKSTQAYEEALDRYPLEAENPKIMSAIIDNYYRLRQRDKAAAAEERLVKDFGPGSKWYEANKDNPDVVTEANKLAENALYNSAVFHHMLAQRLKNEEQVAEASKQYAAAAEGYREYLQRFPQSRNAYELNYYLAECYYYSLQFDKAAVAYASVRDSAAGDKYLTESANSVVLSYSNLVKAAEQSGQLEPLKIYTSKDRPKDRDFTPKEIPELRKQVIAACDAYVDKLPKDEQAGNMAFRAAQIYYAYDHFDEARKRFEEIVARFDDDALSSSSINLIIESYLGAQDWVQVEHWSRKLAALTRDPELKKSLKGFELGARFNNASNMMKKGKAFYDNKQPEEANVLLDKAAAEFARLVDDDPRGDNSDKALNNAALCYTWSNRPISAGKIYERIVKEYPQSEFADNALFLMAYSAEQSYQFERAIANYLKLVDGYKDSKYRADALYNAAVALEGDQQYRKAARAYERYAKLFPDRPDAAENFFRAGEVLEKAEAWRDVIALYQRFTKAFRRDPEQQERRIQAMMKTAQARAKLGDQRRARAGYQDVVKAFDRSGLTAGGRAAEAAAEARFLLSEFALKSYERINFEVPARRLKRTLETKAKSLKKMEDQYKRVFAYKRVEWSLAAYYRLGYLYENFATVLMTAPCPRGLNEEECDIYKGQLEMYAEAPIKKAVEAYALTLEKAKAFKTINEWTRSAHKSLNKYEPLKYPLQKEPAAALVVDRYAPQPLLQVVESGMKPEGK